MRPARGGFGMLYLDAARKKLLRKCAVTFFAVIVVTTLVFIFAMLLMNDYPAASKATGFALLLAIIVSWKIIKAGWVAIFGTDEEVAYLLTGNIEG